MNIKNHEIYVSIGYAFIKSQVSLNVHRAQRRNARKMNENPHRLCKTEAFSRCIYVYNAFQLLVFNRKPSTLIFHICWNFHSFLHKRRNKH